MATPHVTDRKINRSPRTLRRQIDVAIRRNEELRERINEQNREILSLRWKVRWQEMRIAAMQARVAS